MISPFCPKCRAVILPGRSECLDCKEPVRDRSGVTDSLRRVEAPTTRGDLFCPSCHGLILPGDSRCPKCGMLVAISAREGIETSRAADRMKASFVSHSIDTNATKSRTSLRIPEEGTSTTVWAEYLQPAPEEMDANFFQIKTCDYITSNERHRSITENELLFEYDLTDFTFNAAAFPKKNGKYKIKYFVGKAIADRVVAAAVSSADFSIFGEDRLPLEESLTQAFLSIRRMNDAPEVTLADALEIVEGHLLPLSDEIRLGAAREISNKICRYVIAHEFAHILLGHVDLPLAQRRDPDIRKNNERQSDTFASNTVNSSLDREFAFLGGLITFLHFISLEPREAKKEGSSHPSPFERFELLLKNKNSLDSFCARFRTSEKSLRNIAERLTHA